MEGPELASGRALTNPAPPVELPERIDRPGRKRPARVGRGSSFHLGYQPGLDGIRGLSVVLIMLFHSFILWPGLYGNLVPGAYITVNMFFVLSGFLITSLLLEEGTRHGRISFGAFYQRRALRLLPALAFVLAAHLVYTAITGERLGPELAAIGWISVYAANWARWAGKMSQLGTSLSWGHTWTLSVEEQFYLLWPLVIALVMWLRPKVRTLVWWVLAAVAAVTVARAVVTSGVHGGGGPLAQRLEEVVGIRTDLRADTLLLGALGALLLHAGWRPGRALRPIASVVMVGLLVVSFAVQPDARWMYQWGFTLVDAGGALLCVAVLDRGWRPSWVLAAKPCAWLGRLSYALYLWHPPVFVAVIVHAPAHWPVGVKFALGWVITFAAAITSYYCVETPFLKLKGRLSRRAHGSSEPAVTSAVAS